MPRVWGKMRVATSQVIWATNFKELITTESSGGGKGGPKPKSQSTTYSYTVSLAVGLCEGVISGIGDVWADGKLLDLSAYTYRVYNGTETQGVDPKILAVEGAARAPAFRGLAYLVFEDMPLARFGNRVPQLTVEIIRRPPASGPTLEDMLRAVTVIPGTTEFGYATTQVSRISGVNESITDNSNVSTIVSDFVVSMDRLEAEAPSIAAASLVTAWHGTDLRCGVCEIRPRVERTDRATTPFNWQVGPVTRATAQLVSQISGQPAYGSAPADRAVYEAIVNMTARGLAVTLYPFVVLDIIAGNTLPNPYGGTGQAPYPWRGRITCHPAAGQAGTVDKTAASATQVATFFGTCTAAHFGWDTANKVVTYSGPAEWSYRRMVLHYAKLCASAGGVARFIIGSELIGLTQVRSSASVYPAVAQLVSLAAECRTILGAGVKIGYAADWSEYHSHRPGDGTNDVYFNLDSLWSDTNIDFIGIDNYLPLSDWRDGATHLDALTGVASIYDRTYLQSNIEGGEYYQWFYANQGARDAQTRSNITDGVGKPWVYRNKDIKNWWLNGHKNRPGGTESGSFTSWTAQSKPIVFTEFGCPAVDKGSNQPNAFVDAKSAESLYPYYSNTRRDDLIQRAALEAVLDYWNPVNGHNPTSTVYSAPMITWDAIHIWTWDARPFPQFPNRTDIWSDGPNWRLGHWITGRLGSSALRDVVSDIAGNRGAAIDVGTLIGQVDGYLCDGITTPRDLLAQLMKGYFFDAYESEGVIHFKHRGSAAVASLTRQDLVKGENLKDYVLTRAQESELPRDLNLNFYSPDSDYRQAQTKSRRRVGAVGSTVEQSLAIAFSHARASAIADALLFQIHAERETASFALPPSKLALDATDVVMLDTGTRQFRLRIGEIGMDQARVVSARRDDAGNYVLVDGVDVVTATPSPQAPARAVLYFLDLPLLPSGDQAKAGAPHVLAYVQPFVPQNVYRATNSASTPTLDTTLVSPSIVGVLTQPLAVSTADHWDENNKLTVELGAGATLSSKDEFAVFSRANVCAVRTPGGKWEVLQFRDATLIAPRTFELTGLLRGQLGSDTDMALCPIGSAFVVIDTSMQQTALPASLARSSQYWTWGPAGRVLTDPLFANGTFQFEAIGLRPLAPVQVKATRDYAGGTGDVAVNWIRRSRIGGDNWDETEIPLGETSELYDVDIMNGATVVRTLSSVVPSTVYSAAQQVTDWGSQPSVLDLAVYQKSAGYGRGSARRVTLNV